MKRIVVMTLAVFVTACANGWGIFRRTPAPEVRSDSLYWRAVAELDPMNARGSVDSALTYLEKYLSGPEQPRRREVLVLRTLARDAKQLERVEMALQQARSDTTQPRTHTPPEPRRRDDEALLKEIQRLKEELAKANEELDRIRKRLANPKPPSL